MGMVIRAACGAVFVFENMNISVDPNPDFRREFVGANNFIWLYPTS
jgi:hypothetical protein